MWDYINNEYLGLLILLVDLVVFVIKDFVNLCNLI